MRYFLLFLFLSITAMSSSAFANSSKSTYGMSEKQREEYCAEFVRENIIQTRLWHITEEQKVHIIKKSYPRAFSKCFLVTGLRELGSLENCKDRYGNTFCANTTPTSTSELLKPNFDVAANLMTQLSREALHETQKDITDANLPISQTLLIELTSEADQIWQELLRCNAGDAELARVTFITNQSPCFALNDRISNFKNNIYNALAQETPQEFFRAYADNRTYFGFFWNEYNWDQHYFIRDESLPEDKRLNNAEEAHNATAVKRSNSNPQLHPLISQVALNILIKTYFANRSKSFFINEILTPNLPADQRNLFTNSLNLVLEVNNRECVPMGLYPNAGWAAWSKMRRDVLLFGQRLSSEYEDATRAHVQFEHGNTDWYGSFRAALFGPLVGNETPLDNMKKSFNKFKEENNTYSYGVVSSNCMYANLPKIYFDSGDDILKQFNKMDPVIANINLRNLKRDLDGR